MSEVVSLQGKLLIASPSLIDPNFRRAVVLVTEHNDEGAAGLVLNRPSPAPVAEIVPQLEPLVYDGEQVWVGGPVQPNAVLVLGEFLDPDDAAVPLFGVLGFPSLDEPEDVAAQTIRRRVFAGYAGWAPASSRTSSSATTGLSSPRAQTTRSPRILASCGPTSSAARAASTSSSPGSPRIRPSTDPAGRPVPGTQTSSSRAAALEHDGRADLVTHPCRY